ncbi:MAG: valine--tRNA ligase [Chloroflexota bacterium]
MPKTYDPSNTEERLYQWWEENGWFKPEAADPDAKPFVISMPPPNVTGALHIGHALVASIEDLMIRHQRMRGRAALWLPGSDHAGIATQLVVEQALIQEGTSREAIGREAFLKRTWEWKEEHGNHITKQHRRLGVSCDWERERFTLDEGLSRAVREAFVRLFEMGLIYRGERLIIWSPGLRTAVSDLEVEHNDEMGKLYYFKYPIAGRKGEYIPVATTRPETILGDTAVAVHPEDERYRHLHGETCLVPILNRTIPVIQDTYVDREFGTGALKITPGHDPHDFEIGQRHGLPIINLFNPDVTMTSEAGPYEGLDRYECREAMWADMETVGLTLKTEDYAIKVPRSQRGGEVIEPMVSTQWFVNMKAMAELGLEAMRTERIKIVPGRFTKVYNNWLENIRDWCISRQLWWGHRIPVWYCQDCNGMTVEREDPTQCKHCGGADIVQDEDVLDTWFSSALWPFSTLGWPDDTAELERFFPTDIMETAYDILFFWVARMIMTSLLFKNNIPFHTVYLHGLIRDEHGRKMSKSLGNVMDPLELIDQYGTDSLRFSLLTGSSPGNDMSLGRSRLENGRNFTNKLWNAGRFVIGNIDNIPSDDSASELSLADRWILSRLERVTRTVNRLFENHQYGEAGRQIYEFFWSEYADWYIEASKLQLGNGSSAAATGKTLVTVLDTVLRLLHPFIPFVTEEIWQNLKSASIKNVNLAPQEGWAEALIIASWPDKAGIKDSKAEHDFNQLIELIRAIRNARAEAGVDPGRRIVALIQAGNTTPVLDEQKDVLARLARLDAKELVIAPEVKAPDKSVSLVVGEITCYLPLAGMVDLEAEKKRLSNELQDIDLQIQRIEKLLAGPFAQRAPHDVIKREKDKLAQLQITRTQVQARLDSI